MEKKEINLNYEKKYILLIKNISVTYIRFKSKK